MFRSSKLLCSTILLVLCHAGFGQAQQAKKYETAQQAFEVGLTHLRNKSWAEAQEALEAAVKLTSDKKLEGRIMRALLTPHQKHADYTKFKATVEYVIRYPDSLPEKSNHRYALVGFLHARGKSEEVAAQYEELLKKTPDDVHTLYILSGLYSESIRDSRKATVMLERLLKAADDKGEKLEANIRAELVRRYTDLGSELVRGGQPREGAAVFEKLAQTDAKNQSIHLKDAATAWLKAGDKEKALAAAKTAAKGPADSRLKGLTFHWHNQLAEVFYETGQYPLAIEHFQKAVDNADNERFKQGATKKLELAKKKA